MNKLEQVLHEKFPNKKIVKLKDFTSKIAIIPKVRYGNNRTDDDYDEISLNYVDEYGVIYIPDNYKNLGPANATTLANQVLRESDLIIIHRGKIGKMGIVGNQYKRRIVGNNSMIRLQFKNDRREDTPWFVMQYLQLPYVKEYINTYIPSSGSSKRKILNPEVLSNLPIPLFEEMGGRYKSLLHTQKALKSLANNIQQKSIELIKIYDSLEDNSVEMVMCEDEKTIETQIDINHKEMDESFTINQTIEALLQKNIKKIL